MENSAEYNTLIGLTSELRLAVRPELTSLTGSLLASRLISLDNDIELRNTAHSVVERSARLVELIQNKVRQNPRHYHSFVGILQGNQEQYRDILQQLEQASQEPRWENGVKSGVVSCIYDLESQFRQLNERLLTELEANKVSGIMVLRSLTLLPIEIRFEYKTAITEVFSILHRESTVSDLFYHLSPLMDFLNYGLLKYLIDMFGSDYLKMHMVVYSNDVLVFMKKTTVKQLVDIWPDQCEISPKFSKLRARVTEDPSVYTLIELDQFQKCFCNEIKLTDTILILVFVQQETANSFIAEWLIPSVLIPQFMESAMQLSSRFYLQRCIIEMSLDEKQIFSILSDPKPKVSVLQASTVMIKVGENSPEYSTLIDLTSELRLAVRPELVSLTGSLLASRLISLDNDIELRNTAHSEVERSARLVELVQNKVRQNPRHYHSFIGILQGNQEQYRDILQQLEQACQEHQQEHGIASNCTDVRHCTNKLQRCFRGLLESILTELEERSISVSKLLRSLTLLPMEIVLEYKAAITKIFSDLRREPTVSDLFFHLGPLIDFLSYGLLKYIIDEFGSDPLKMKMDSYCDDVIDFMKKTTVKQLMDVWPGQQDVPPGFSKLNKKIDENLSTYTLYDLDELRKRYCCELKLTVIVFTLIGLNAANSFVAEWLIPSVLIPQLIESARKLDFGFYLQERILKVTVDEKQVFPMLPDAKPNVPVLQTAAATVTDLPGHPDTKEVFEQAITREQQCEIQRFRNKLRNCALYSNSGVGIYIKCGFNSWESKMLTLEGYVTVCTDSILYLNHRDLFTTVAQFITYPKPPAAAESSDSPPFVIAIFVSKKIYCTRDLNVVDDTICPFLPQSAPHLQHIPKLFFITSIDWLCTYPHVRRPNFPDDPDGNYCVAYHVTIQSSLMDKWAKYITDNLFVPGMTVQEAIENSRSHLVGNKERLYYFNCLKNKLVLKKYKD